MRLAQQGTTAEQGKQFWALQLSDDGLTGELEIYGDIVDWRFWDEDVSPKQFAKELAALGSITNLTVRINSYGGSLFAGYSIYQQIKRHTAAVTVYIDGIAASAASVIAMAGDRIVMPIGSYMMVHNPLQVVWGMYYADELKKLAATLDTVREGMLSIYSTRTGKSREDVISLLDAETWMHADSAVEEGFADEVEGAAVEASLNGKTLIMNGVPFDTERFANGLPESLRKGGKPMTVKPKAEVTETEEVEQAEAETEEVEQAEAETEGVEQAEPEAQVDPILAAERQRVAAIMELQRPGAEGIIKDAIASDATAGDVAQAILKSPEVKAAALLQKRSADGHLVNVVPGVAAPDAEDPKAATIGRLVGFMKRFRPAAR